MAENRQKAAESGLSARQEKALIALLSTPTQEGAAKQAGVAARTLREYLRTPAFRAEYQRRRRELMSSAITLAQQNAAMMVAVQISIARDRDMPASVRVSAANNVFGIADNGRKTEDLDERIAALEVRIAESGISNRRNGKAAYPFQQ